MEVDVKTPLIYLPCYDLSFKAIHYNFKPLKPQKGFVRITGAIYYIAFPLNKSVLTIHDDDYVSKSIFFKLFLNFFLILNTFLEVNKITVISEFTKNQLVKFIPWNKNNIEVIYNTVNPNLQEMIKF